MPTTIYGESPLGPDLVPTWFLDGEHLPHALDLHDDRGIGGPRDGLDLGLQPVVSFDAASHAVVVHAEQDTRASSMRQRCAPKLLGDTQRYRG